VRLRDDTDGPARASDARYASRTTLNQELEIDGDLDTLRGFTISRGLDAAQIDAVASLCANGATISVLVAPAGTGKTTTLSAGVAAWQHKLHSVVALAPSARAAKELGLATGLPADTVAKFRG
jgi:flagellar biosynthesis GTPase FlhF